MKLLSRFTLINLFCFTSLTAAADDYNAAYGQQTSSNTENLVQYLVNLGQYLGYDLTQNPNSNNQNPPSAALINPTLMEMTQTLAYSTFLGAIPVDFVSQALGQFLPPNIQGASVLNELANKTFTYQNYQTPSGTQNGNVTVSNLIDQPSAQTGYLGDPVSQAVFNILGTPDYSYCMNNDGTQWISNCSLMYQNLVMENVIGPVPTTYQFYTYQYNQPVISQLNSNSLLGPLLYNTDSTQGNTTGSPTPNTQNPGLTAQNQAQIAANFIRYVSGAVTPPTLPKLQDYDNLYNIAYPPKGNTPNIPQQAQAQATLSAYLNNLRTFAAQSSVGMSNLYYILSKRLPQSQNTSSPITSQAVNEFNMATWRLFTPTQGDNSQTANKQWIEKINTASPGTVEKEIAVLLAEINYQMYLDRQLQERILLTNTIMLMQNLKAGQPTADFSSQGSTSN
jgi:intracellular multiplication protein IcmX